MKKYIYILSQRYSGSTLLSFLLSTHPDISTIGERRKFYNKVIHADLYQHHRAKHCSCGELFKECPYLNDIKEEVLKKVQPSWLETNATELKIYDNKYANKLAYEIHRRTLPLGFTPFQKRVQQQAAFNEILIDAILNKDGTSVFLDSSKIINQALYLSQIKAFDFYVIWLTRDPRAQVASTVKHQGWSVQKAVDLWKKEMLNNEKILHQFGIKNIKVRYTDLCSDTEGEMKKILEFAGLDSSQFSLKFREQEHHIMGNFMRLQQDQKIVERKEWKDKLSSEDIELINRETKAYAQFYS